jgi:hypothetical protein
MILLLAHPFPLLSHHQVVSPSQSPCVSQVELTKGRGEGRGWRGEKALSSINYSLLSGLVYVHYSIRLMEQ